MTPHYAGTPTADRRAERPAAALDAAALARIRRLLDGQPVWATHIRIAAVRALLLRADN